MRHTLLLMIFAAACGCGRKEVDVAYGAMILDVGGARTIENPTDKQLQSELEGLSVADGDAFAILGSSDMTYIQVSGNESVGFNLEYQDGSVDAHFRSTEENLTLTQVVEAFKSYRDGSENWQAGLTFEKLTW